MPTSTSIPAAAETVTARWTFGVDPLPQTERVAALVREVTGLVLSLEEEDPGGPSRLVADLEQAKGCRWRGPVRPRRRPAWVRPCPVLGGVPRPHAFDIGAYNPCVPEYALEVDGARAHGSVTFPLAYEGPPGLVHGGFLALFFDCAVQHHNCEVGVAGKTTSLASATGGPRPCSPR